MGPGIVLATAEPATVLAALPEARQIGILTARRPEVPAVIIT